MTKFALIVVLPLAILSLSGIMVVDVKEGGPDGARIVVPVPLLLVQACTPFLPEEARADLKCDADRMQIAAARQVLSALERQPDFTLVEVTDGDEHVLVRKQGRYLLVDVRDGEDEEVHCRVPLKAAGKLLNGFADGRLTAGEAVRAVCGQLPPGDVVRVRDHGDQVRIWRL